MSGNIYLDPETGKLNADADHLKKHLQFILKRPSVPIQHYILAITLCLLITVASAGIGAPGPMKTLSVSILLISIFLGFMFFIYVNECEKDLGIYRFLSQEEEFGKAVFTLSEPWAKEAQIRAEKAARHNRKIETYPPQE